MSQNQRKSLAGKILSLFHFKFSVFDKFKKDVEISKKIDFATDVRQALLEDETPYANLILQVVAVFFVVFLIWSAFAKLDERTVGEGSVIPSSQLKYIQSLEGGIVKDIMIHEGQKVKKDEILIKLDDTASQSNYGEERAKYLALQATIARLEAETSGAEKIIFPSELEEKYKEIVKSENDLFQSRKENFQNKLEVLKKSYELSSNELKMTEPLVKQGVISQIDLMRLEREVNEKKGAINEFSQNFQQDAFSDLTKRKAEFAALSESILTQQDRVSRSTLKSPVNGTIKKLNVSTIGQITKPGENIVEIVPDEDSLLIRAKINPREIGFIHPDEPATVKITAYDFSIYGGLEGKVEYISADTITNQKGEAFYEIDVRTNRNYLGSKENPLKIIPGMTATVHILTGEKTVLQYLLKPLIKAKQNALRER